MSWRQLRYWTGARSQPRGKYTQISSPPTVNSQGSLSSISSPQALELYSLDEEDSSDVPGTNDNAFHRSYPSHNLEIPTEEEKRRLRRISDRIPPSAFLIAIVELCERFAYYGFSGPFQNYIQYSPSDHIPGALGLGQQGATALTTFFQLWCYVTPTFGAIVADQYFGRFKTILYSAYIYMVGILILFVTSLPMAIYSGISKGGLILSMIIIGVATGGIKSNVSPLIAEQYTETTPYIKHLPNGERVIVDPAITIQRIYMMFYLCINLGSLSSIITTTLEMHVGFWAAYLLPLCMFMIGMVVLVLGKNNYISQPPEGSVIFSAIKAVMIGIRNGSLDAAKPSKLAKLGLRTSVPWSDSFVDELRKALMACKVFCFFPLYWLTYGQMMNNFVSQAGQMQLHGIPNDIMGNIDPLTIILFIPLLDKVIYPALRRLGIVFKPITRIFMGFLFGAIAMAYAAYVQNAIYHAGPCYQSPGACPAALIPGTTNQYEANHIHVAWQVPAYFFVGLSEIFASTTGLEYAFTKAPSSMKSIIMSMFLLTTAVGSALQETLVSLAVDPKLFWMYTGLSITTFIAGIVFWNLFKHYNDAEDGMDERKDLT